MWHHMNGFIGEYGWGWSLFGLLHMLAFWALVVGVIWLAVRLLGGGRSEKTALDILQERYARGEIDKAEYDRRRADLMRG